MTKPPFEIDGEIEKAATLPSRVYSDPGYFNLQKDRVFSRTWQFVQGANTVKAAGHVRPFTLLEGCLDEPLVLSRNDDDRLHCLSNVCTHRGALVVEGEGHQRSLRCRYHGRKFALDGALVSMPEFDDVIGFPSPSDNLPSLGLEQWGPLHFTALDPAFSFSDWMGPVEERIGWMPLDEFRLDPETSRDYTINSNWALYCDNYLEEFHIPYVHAASLTGLDYEAYRTELFRYGNLQLGVGRAGEPIFDLPEGHRDSGEPMAAYYFWLFPNLMLNFYPWGLSVNVVQPLSVGRTRVSFLSYVWDAPRRAGGVGSDLHRVEMEDEEIVESCQRGIRSRLYDRGRYAPRREAGVHHFHSLLAEFLTD